VPPRSKESGAVEVSTAPDSLQVHILACAVAQRRRYLPLFLIVSFFEAWPVKPPPSVTVSVTVME
jgi:hypothetical protein